jgi:dienelactone hydrolase
MGIQLETLELRTRDDLPLRIDLRHDPARPDRGLVLVCHGFKGFRRWGFFPWVGEQLASAGWRSAVLDFSRNGIGDDPLEFDRLDLFERNTYSAELDDMDLALAELRSRWGDERPLCLLGHSRAAVNVIVRAVEDPQVSAVVTWNGVGSALRVTDRQLETWEREGRLDFVNSRTGQKMAMSFDFVRDVRAQPERFDLAGQAARLRVPQLVVHAEGDLAVPVDESLVLLSGADKTAARRRVVLPGSGHTFGAVHPFAGPTRTLEEAMQSTLDWLAEHVGGER